MNDRIAVSEERLAEYCRRWMITELSLFGSVLRDDFGPNSDIDLLVRFDAKAGHTLFDLVRMESELKDLLGRDVDLVERAAIERSRNPLRRREILDSAQLLYAA